MSKQKKRRVRQVRAAHVTQPAPDPNRVRVGVYYETLRAFSDDPVLMKAVDAAEQAQKEELLEA